MRRPQSERLLFEHAGVRSLRTRNPETGEDLWMATCYLCALNALPTEDPSAIAGCTRCGVFCCRWDGARHHGTGHFYCAVCLVPMLLRASGIDIGDWPGGGDDGGGSGLYAVREELAVDEFERFCADMWDASRPQRLKWREVLGPLDQRSAATVVAERIGEFAGGERRVERAYRAAPGVETDDVAAAVGVAELAARRRAARGGSLTLPGSRLTAEHRSRSAGQAAPAVGAAPARQKRTALRTRTVGGSS